MKLLSFFLLVCLIACETQKVEYHTRSAWQYSMRGNSLQDKVVRDDGTIVKYTVVGGSASQNVQKYLDSIDLETKDKETGQVTLNAVLPEQLLSQILVCLRDRKWDILFEQILSKSAQNYFKSQSDELRLFENFFEVNRRELAKLFQKMIQGRQFGDICVNDTGAFMELTFSPNMVGNFQFRKIILQREGQFLKLHSIE